MTSENFIEYRGRRTTRSGVAQAVTAPVADLAGAASLSVAPRIRNSISGVTRDNGRGGVEWLRAQPRKKCLIVDCPIHWFGPHSHSQLLMALEGGELFEDDYMEPYIKARIKGKTGSSSLMRWKIVQQANADLLEREWDADLEQHQLYDLTLLQMLRDLKQECSKWKGELEWNTSRMRLHTWQYHPALVPISSHTKILWEFCERLHANEMREVPDVLRSLRLVKTLWFEFAGLKKPYGHHFGAWAEVIDQSEEGEVGPRYFGHWGKGKTAEAVKRKGDPLRQRLKALLERKPDSDMQAFQWFYNETYRPGSESPCKRCGYIGLAHISCSMCGFDSHLAFVEEVDRVDAPVEPVSIQLPESLVIERNKEDRGLTVEVVADHSVSPKPVSPDSKQGRRNARRLAKKRGEVLLNYKPVAVKKEKKCSYVGDDVRKKYVSQVNAMVRPYGTWYWCSIPNMIGGTKDCWKCVFQIDVAVDYMMPVDVFREQIQMAQILGDPVENIFVILSVAETGEYHIENPPDLPEALLRGPFDQAIVDEWVSRPHPGCTRLDDVCRILGRHFVGMYSSLKSSSIAVNTHIVNAVDTLTEKVTKLAADLADAELTKRKALVSEEDEERRGLIIRRKESNAYVKTMYPEVLSVVNISRPELDEESRKAYAITLCEKEHFVLMPNISLDRAVTLTKHLGVVVVPSPPIPLYDISDTVFDASAILLSRTYSSVTTLLVDPTIVAIHAFPKARYMFINRSTTLMVGCSCGAQCGILRNAVSDGRVATKFDREFMGEATVILANISGKWLRKLVTKAPRVPIYYTLSVDLKPFFGLERFEVMSGSVHSIVNGDLTDSWLDDLKEIKTDASDWLNDPQQLIIRRAKQAVKAHGIYCVISGAGQRMEVSADEKLQDLQPMVIGDKCFGKRTFASVEANYVVELYPTQRYSSAWWPNATRYYAVPDFFSNDWKNLYIPKSFLVEKNALDRIWSRCCRAAITLEDIATIVNTASLTITLQGVETSAKLNTTLDEIHKIVAFIALYQANFRGRFDAIIKGSTGIFSEIVQKLVGKIAHELQTYQIVRNVVAFFRYFGGSTTLQQISDTAFERVLGAPREMASVYGRIMSFLRVSDVVGAINRSYGNKVGLEDALVRCVRQLAGVIGVDQSDNPSTLVNVGRMAGKVVLSTVKTIGMVEGKLFNGFFTIYEFNHKIIRIVTKLLFGAVEKVSKYVVAGALWGLTHMVDQEIGALHAWMDVLAGYLGEEPIVRQLRDSVKERMNRIPQPMDSEEVVNGVFDCYCNTDDCQYCTIMRAETLSYLVGLLAQVANGFDKLAAGTFALLVALQDDIREINLPNQSRLFSCIVEFAGARQSGDLSNLAEIYLKSARGMVDRDPSRLAMMLEKVPNVQFQKVLRSKVAAVPEISVLDKVVANGPAVKADNHINVYAHPRVKRFNSEEVQQVMLDRHVTYTNYAGPSNLTPYWDRERGPLIDYNCDGFIERFKYVMTWPHNVENAVLPQSQLDSDFAKLTTQMREINLSCIAEVPNTMSYDVGIFGLPCSGKSAGIRKTLKKGDAVVVPTKVLQEEWKKQVDKGVEVFTMHQLLTKKRMFKTIVVDEVFQLSAMNVALLRQSAATTIVLGDPSQIGAIFATQSGMAPFEPQLFACRANILFPVSYVPLDALNLFAWAEPDLLGYAGDIYCASSVEVSLFCKRISEMPENLSNLLTAKQFSKGLYHKQAKVVATVHEFQGGRLKNANVLMDVEQSQFYKTHACHYRVAISRATETTTFWYEAESSIKDLKGYQEGLNGRISILKLPMITDIVCPLVLDDVEKEDPEIVYWRNQQVGKTFVPNTVFGQVSGGLVRPANLSTFNIVKEAGAIVKQRADKVVVILNSGGGKTYNHKLYGGEDIDDHLSFGVGTTNFGRLAEAHKFMLETDAKLVFLHTMKQIPNPEQWNILEYFVEICPLEPNRAVAYWMQKMHRSKDAAIFSDRQLFSERLYLDLQSYGHYPKCATGDKFVVSNAGKRLDLGVKKEKKPELFVAADRFEADMTEVEITDISIKHPTLKEFNFVALFEKTLTINPTNMAKSMASFVNELNRCSKNNVDWKTVVLTAEQKACVRRLFKRRLVIIDTEEALKNSSQWKQVVESISDPDARDLGVKSFTKGQLGKKFDVMKRQGVLFRGVALQALFAGWIHRITTFIKANLRDGLFVDVGYSEQELQAKIQSIRRHYQAYSGTPEDDIESQDTNHTMAHVKIFEYISELSGSRQIFDVIFRQCREEVVVKAMDNVFKATNTLGLGSGDPWTLIANIMMMLSCIAIDSDFTEFDLYAQKGDDGMSSRVLKWKKKEDCLFPNVKYKRRNKPLGSFCSRVYLTFIVRQIGRRLYSAKRLLISDVNFKDKLRDLTSLAADIREVGEDVYGAVLDMAFDYPKGSGERLVDEFIIVHSNLLGYLSTNELLMTKERKTRRVVNVEKYCAWEALVAVAGIVRASNYVNNVRRLDVNIDRYMEILTKERLSYKVENLNYDGNRLSHFMLKNAGFRGIVVFKDHVVAVVNTDYSEKYEEKKIW